MPSFTCTLNISNLPAEVRRGSSIAGVVTVVSASAPVQGVIIAADRYGLGQRFKKINDTTFTLDLKVPLLVPPGKYQYAVWAVSDRGDPSAKQTGFVVIR